MLSAPKRLIFIKLIRIISNKKVRTIIMIDDRKTQNNDNVISDTTFWDLYPVDLSSVEDVSVQSLPVSVRVTNLLIHNGVKTVADLFRMKVEDFMRLRGAGTKCYDETCKYLAALSNKAVSLESSLIKSRIANNSAKVIAENIESILNQDFSFLWYPASRIRRY